ncbi:Immediate early response protein [Actinidia chinensis var. chinensis]|uniref:Immediate early response protein n=1 Tax=Actinidia chinensis var. chinensis TaxID=1590841 RepID=A0A2R6PEM1_ACTCC|nr:Immediate early response protein [Actinidia chinensis var. chinensis]
MASEGGEQYDEAAEMLPRRRCCFCIPRFGSDRSPAAAGLRWWRRMRPAESDEGWLARGINALKKAREWSEIAAGPRWKTFIRQFNRSKSGGRYGGKFQYDPLSYALNFDDPGQNGHLDEEYGSRNFSSRFAAIPMPAPASK